MKVIKHTELKKGDLFIVPTPSYAWRNYVNCYSEKDVVLLFDGTNVRQWPDGAMTGAIVGSLSDQVRLMHQDVTLIDKEEITPINYIKSAQPRINRTTGADPEIFVTRGKSESLIPAFKFLPAQSDVKKGLGFHSAEVDAFHPAIPAFAYRDGFAAEFFANPVSCHGYFMDFIRSGLMKVASAAERFDRTAKLSIQNHFEIPQITMDNATDEDIALGCLPSLNAYGDQPMLPASGRSLMQRFAGGHVHLGINLLKADEANNIAKACDITAGIPCVALFASLDTPMRRQFYGRAGEYRKPAHGIEYRTLSNAWLATPEIAHLVLNLVRTGSKIGKANLMSAFDISEAATQEIINFCDVGSARKFVNDRADLFVALLEGDGHKGTPGLKKAFLSVINGGMEALFPNFADIAANWDFGLEWKPQSNGYKKSWGYTCQHLPTVSTSS